MASVGLAATNSGSLAFIYNNLTGAVTGTVASNTNGVIALPYVQGLDPQAALQMSAKNPGGACYRQNAQVVAPAVANPVSLISGFESVFARLGYTKGGALLITSNTNGTQAITADLTNTQTNTNAFWGDTTFATINVITVKNQCNQDGIGNNNGTWTLNTAVANSFVPMATTNGTAYTIPSNGSLVCFVMPQGQTCNAANCKLNLTPSNGGSVVVEVYGS